MSENEASEDDVVPFPTPGQPGFERLVDVVASGSRAVDGVLHADAELLCRRDDRYYLCRRDEADEWRVVASARTGSGVDDADAAAACLDVAETELFAPEEYGEWLEATELTLSERASRRDHCWTEFVVDGDVVLRVPEPDHPDFDDMVTAESSAASSGSRWGPTSTSYGESVVEYRGHRFLVTGDHEGGGRDIELLDDVEASLPDGWSHPSSLIVLDSSGDEISLGFDEDLDHEDQFEDLSDVDEEDHTADEAWIEQWREAKDRAESLLDRLRIGHRGVAVVGPGASPTLPSNDPWLAFETTVDIAELDSKTGPVSTAIVDGREAAFSDRLPLAVAARLAWPDVVIHLTDDTVSIFDTELLAFVAHRPRVS